MKYLIGTLTILCGIALSSCGPTEGGRATTNVPDPSRAIQWREVSTVSKDQPEKLRALLTDSSFLVRMVWGREYVYFAPSGRAYFWDTRDRKIVTGSWSILPARIGTDFVCWAKGGLPDDLAGKALVDNCRSAASFVGIADYLSRGDVFGLAAGRAPE